MFRIRNIGMRMETPAAYLKLAGDTHTLAYEMSVAITSKMNNKRLTFFTFNITNS